MDIPGSVMVQNGHQQSFRVMTSSWGQLGSNKRKIRRSTSVKGLTPLLTSELNEIGLRIDTFEKPGSYVYLYDMSY